jgi:phosphate transport system substrate-binding protein
MLPSAFTVSTEDYVLSRRLFLYTPAVSSNPWVAPFVEFSLSPEGQSVVDEVGFVAQRIEVEKVAPSDAMPADYAAVAGQSAGRLSMSFRFVTGQAVLDSKGVRDLERVARFLAQPENRRRQVTLLGFSDNSGTRSANVALSQERADAVASQFRLRGITVAKAVGLGPEMPVVSNATAAGREKNRRVEVWIN